MATSKPHRPEGTVNLTLSQALDAYFKSFGETPAVIPTPPPDEMIKLIERAVERGSPLTVDDFLERHETLLADWRAVRMPVQRPQGQ
jgi:hypothetical protein